MAHYISMLVLMAVFMAVGVYWALGATHFLRWTTAHNASLHQQIDGHIGRPVLTSLAMTNYARMQANGGMRVFTWAVRGIGICMAGAALFTSGMIVASII